VDEEFPVFYAHPQPEHTDESYTFNYTCAASAGVDATDNVKYTWNQVAFVS